MHKERKFYLLKTSLKQPGKNLGHDEIAFFCPKHGARSERTIGQLSVNLVTDKFHCWSCGFSGKNLTFLLPKGSSEWKEYVESLDILKPKEQEKVYDHPKLPEEFVTLTKQSRSPYFSAATGYLEKRGIGKKDIVKWKLGYCEEGDFKSRIIIPSFDEMGLLNFFTGRAFYDGMTRYKNGNFSKDIIFNDYMIDWKKPITITEGPFDAFKISDNVIALQGNILTSGTKLFSRIVLSGVDVFLAMDSDAFNKQLRIIEELLSYGVGCNFVSLNDKKDVGEMTHQEFVIAKQKSVKIRNDVDILKMRIHS